MPLVNLQTDLKSLRYGTDRRDGASSGQPYIQKPIPTRDINSGLGDEDFLLRGGSLAPSAVANDVSRITKMMFDLKSPNGLLFTAKQEVLSRSAVNIKAGLNTNNKLPLNNGIYLPTSTILQTGVLAAGGHLLKQGINPFASTNNVANGNILSLGFGSAFPLANPIYLDTDAQNERQNPNLPPTSRLIKFLNNKINTNQGDQLNLYSYSGGPGSTLGVGNTFIPLSNQRTGLNNPFLAGSPDNTNKFIASEVASGSFDYSVFNRPQISGSLITKGSKIFNSSVSKLYQGITSVDLLQGQYNTTNNDSGAFRSFTTNVYQSGSFQASSTVRGLDTTLDYNQIQNAFQTTPSSLSQIVTGSNGQNDGGSNNIYQKGQILQDFRQKTKSPSVKSLDYDDETQRYSGRVNLGDPGRKNVPRVSYQSGIGEATNKINALPIYRGKNIDRSLPINDFVKFRIGVIDNDNPEFKNYIHFRALIDNLSDSYGAQWNGTKFAGRGEEFYNYDGFNRSINLGWTVAAQSKAEIMEQWKKLNYLASVCAPSYSKDGYMRGNLIELTLGGWLYKQIGFISGLELGLPEESPWEIAIPDQASSINYAGVSSDPTVKEMPMICTVSGFEFTPIHDFVPSIQDLEFGADDTGRVSEYGPQRYISLSNGSRRGDNNYDRLESVASSIRSSGIAPINAPLPSAPVINLRDS